MLRADCRSDLDNEYDMKFSNFLSHFHWFGTHILREINAQYLRLCMQHRWSAMMSIVNTQYQLIHEKNVH